MEFDYSVFRKQFAMILEGYINAERKERIVSEAEEFALGVSTAFLRDDNFIATTKREKAVIATLIEKYEESVESTVLSLSDLN